MTVIGRPVGTMRLSRKSDAKEIAELFFRSLLAADRHHQHLEIEHLSGRLVLAHLTRAFRKQADDRPQEASRG